MGKKKMGILISVVLVLTVVAIAFIVSKPEDMYSHIAIGCSVEEYSQQQDIGYVTLKIDDAKNTIKEFKVVDKELQNQLAENNLTNVIGVNMLMTLPAEEMKKSHFDINTINVFDLLYNTNTYDKYIVVTGINLK